MNVGVCICYMVRIQKTHPQNVSHNSASRDGEPFTECVDSVTKFRRQPSAKVLHSAK